MTPRAAPRSPRRSRVSAGVDVLVNAAGTTQFVPLSDLDGQKAEDFQKVYAVNVIGPYQMARAAAPHLRASGAGAIVNVSSVGSLNGNGSSYSYVTSKAALNTLTLALARNLAPEIRVNCVLPGLITDALAERWARRGGVRARARRLGRCRRAAEDLHGGRRRADDRLARRRCCRSSPGSCSPSTAASCSAARPACRADGRAAPRDALRRPRRALLRGAAGAHRRDVPRRRGAQSGSRRAGAGQRAHHLPRARRNRSKRSPATWRSAASRRATASRCCSATVSSSSSRCWRRRASASSWCR